MQTHSDEPLSLHHLLVSVGNDVFEYFIGNVRVSVYITAGAIKYMYISAKETPKGRVIKKG